MWFGGIAVHIIHTRMIHESLSFILCVYCVCLCCVYAVCILCVFCAYSVCILCVFYVSCVYPTRAIHADVAIIDKVVGGNGGRKSE